MEIGKKRCPLCKKMSSLQQVDIHTEMYYALIQKIKKNHPAWFEKEGMCQACFAYYKKVITDHIP